MDRKREIELLAKYVGCTVEEAEKRVKFRFVDVKQDWSIPKSIGDTSRWYTETDHYIYDCFDSQFGLVGDAMYANGRKCLIRKLVDDGVQTVLDFGCGTGYFATALYEEGFAVTAADLPSKHMEFFKYRNKENHHLMDVIELSGNLDRDFGTKKWDAITSLDVLEHLPSVEAVENTLHWMNSRSPLVYGNITFGKFYGLHPEHLPIPSKEVGDRIKKLYREAYV